MSKHDVSYMHVRDGEDSNRVLTIAIHTQEHATHFAYSMCRPLKDGGSAFTKAMGRIKAGGRLKSEALRITVPEVRREEAVLGFFQQVAADESKREVVRDLAKQQIPWRVERIAKKQA